MHYRFMYCKHFHSSRICPPVHIMIFSNLAVIPCMDCVGITCEYFMYIILENSTAVFHTIHEAFGPFCVFVTFVW